MEKEKLEITLEQLHKLYKLQFLSGKGMDYYIDKFYYSVSKILEDGNEPTKENEE